MKSFVVNLTNTSATPSTDEYGAVIGYDTVKHPAAIQGSIVLNDRTNRPTIELYLDDFCKYVADVLNVTLDDTITQAHVSDASYDRNIVTITFASGAGE